MRATTTRRLAIVVLVVVVADAVALLSAGDAAGVVDSGLRRSASAVGLTHARWHPRPGVTWQWQLDGRVDTTVGAKVYDIDGFDASHRLVRRLHRLGRKVICYIDAGAYESYRSDADRFPRIVLGKANPEWPGQRWLDIRRLDILGPIMVDRLRMCARKGFDGVELDEIDGYSNDTGFPLKASDQLRYNRWLARETRRLGLAAGLKNDVEQIPALVERFDFAVNEQCFQYRECRSLLPFIRAGKAVLHVEYHVSLRRFCPTTTRLGFSSMRKGLDLRRWRKPCPSVAPSAIARRPGRSFRASSGRTPAGPPSTASTRAAPGGIARAGRGRCARSGRSPGRGRAV